MKNMTDKKLLFCLYFSQNVASLISGVKVHHAMEPYRVSWKNKFVMGFLIAWIIKMNLTVSTGSVAHWY